MNHFSEIMTDAYDLLVKRKVRWTIDMTFEQKVSLYESAINYWRERGEYERCLELQKKLSKVYKDQKNNR